VACLHGPTCIWTAVKQISRVYIVVVVVENIKSFRAKFEADALGNGKFLAPCQMHSDGSCSPASTRSLSKGDHMEKSQWATPTKARRLTWP
jgi:hypothetical protein